MDKKDYYQEKLNEIRLLMKTDLFKAKTLLDEELAMPYIPLKYEQDFIDLAQDNMRALSVKMSNKTLNDEEVIEYLWSKDELREAIVLDYLKGSNLRKFKSELVKWIETKPKTKNIAKSFIYELLVLQEINVEIKWDNMIVNPMKNKSIFDNQEINKGINEIKKLTFKEPSLEATLLEEFEKTVLTEFPIVIKNGELIAKNIYETISKALKD